LLPFCLSPVLFLVARLFFCTIFLLNYNIVITFLSFTIFVIILFFDICIYSILIFVLEVFPLSEEERKVLQISLILVLFCFGVSSGIMTGDGAVVDCSCRVCAILCSMTDLPLVLFSAVFQGIVIPPSVSARVEIN